MIEIKIRIKAIDNCFQKGGGSLSFLDTEFCFLQSRKIIEQICFSSILCDQKRYEDFRKIEGLTNKKDHGNYVKDWKSPVILKKLKDINPYFMPRPLGEQVILNNVKHFKEGFQTTHKELINMWEKCGSFMHIPKPFGEKNYKIHIDKIRTKYSEATETIKNYNQYFKNLLWKHAAIGLEYKLSDDAFDSLDPANPETAWLVNFGDYEDDSVLVQMAKGV